MKYLMLVDDSIVSMLVASALYLLKLEVDHNRK